MKTNHWGITVDSEIPVTGVLSLNSVNWEMMDDFGICPICEQISEEEEDFIECDPSHEKLLGGWRQTRDGVWEVDKSTDDEFSAIEREDVIQIVWSKYTKRGALCSPCYPGQVDLDSRGEFLGYTLPEYLIYKEE